MKCEQENIDGKPVPGYPYPDVFEKNGFIYKRFNKDQWELQKLMDRFFIEENNEGSFGPEVFYYETKEKTELYKQFLGYFNTRGEKKEFCNCYFQDIN